ncbi:hypothetical protein ACQJBY_010831 [Aegilops geniculata]
MSFSEDDEGSDCVQPFIALQNCIKENPAAFSKEILEEEEKDEEAEKSNLQVTKNIFLLKSLDELFQKGREAVDFPALQELMQKTGFDMDDVVRKYIRYTLNEKQFNPDVVVDLIHLRKASMLEDNEVAEILNEISRRIVREKGPIVMDLSGFTEQGFKRKLAVQTLFGKIMYLSELPEFCSRDGSLVVKEIFGVTDEDADSLRSRTLSEAGDIESLERMVDDSDEHGTPSSS